MAGRLTEDFRVSSNRYVAQEITTEMLLTKYGLLLKFQAQTLEEKEALAETLLDGALKALELRVQPSYDSYISSSEMDGIGSLLARLEEQDSLQLVPARAPAALAELGIQYIAKAEAMEGNNIRTDRDRMTRFAQMCLEHAEKIKDIVDKRAEDISTSKMITPARRISLKAANDGPAS